MKLMLNHTFVNKNPFLQFICISVCYHFKLTIKIIAKVCIMNYIIFCLYLLHNSECIPKFNVVNNNNNNNNVNFKFHLKKWNDVKLK
jgi:hypothetical protein